MGHAPLHAAGKHVFPVGILFAPNHPSWGTAAFTSDVEAYFRHYGKLCIRPRSPH